MRLFLAAFIALIITGHTMAEPVTLDTATGVIHGTLLVAEKPTPGPVVVLIAGSGPVDRDGNVAQLGVNTNTLKLLAESLASDGISSLRYDKRGIAASAKAGSAEIDLRFEHYVNDAAGWARQVAADPRFNKVVLIGHSEGALIALLAAGEVDVAGVVSISGVGRTADKMIAEQLQAGLPKALLEQSLAILNTLKAGKTTDDVPAELAALFRPSVQPYLMSWFKHNPSTIIAQLDKPVLILHGDRDVQVPVSDAERLHEHAKRSQLHVIKGMTHVLKQAVEDDPSQMKVYTDPSLPIDPTLVEAIAAFVHSPNEKAEAQ